MGKPKKWGDAKPGDQVSDKRGKYRVKAIRCRARRGPAVDLEGKGKTRGERVQDRRPNDESAQKKGRRK